MNLNKALSIAALAHEGQVDKSGVSHILHPLRVMMEMHIENEMIVAILHDVVEDTDMTLNDLKSEGFSDIIIDAVDAISRREDETVREYFDRVIDNRIARRVKIKDIEDNLRVTRLLSVTKKELNNISMYHKYWKKLKEIEFNEMQRRFCD